MIAFTDQQLAELMQAAASVPLEKRAAFVQQTATYLEWHGSYDEAPDAFERAINLALRYVTESAA